MRWQQEEGLWAARVALAQERAEQSRRAASDQTAVQESGGATAQVAPQEYDPEAPALFQPGVWQLLYIRRGRTGTQDPRRRRPPASRGVALHLRIPQFITEPQHVFPPVNLTRGVTFSEPGTGATPIIVDCPNSPSRPWGLRHPPRLTEGTYPQSPPMPLTSPPAVPRTPRDAADSPDSEVLFLSASETPEHFSPSLIGLSPARPTPGLAQPPRRHLHF